jgi:tetratricopeptide (TPR) repeat protein
VQHAHQKGIIHRDIKPTNVLVPEVDGEAVPKVIDFGVAKAVSQKLTDETLYTRFEQVVGTPLYMSPEQAGAGVVDIDTRSDIYSLGVLLYELLTGDTPFDRETLKRSGFDEFRRMLREEQPRRPSHAISTLNAEALSTVCDRRACDLRKLTQAVRGELDWIVMKALEKDRSRRYETANGLARDLERYLNSEPVEACPPTIGYRLSKHAKRHKGLLASTGLVVTSLLIGVGASLWYAGKANREAFAAREARELAVRRSEESLAAREDADKNFHVALKTVETMLLRLVDDQIARLPVTVRDHILTDAEQMFDRLLEYDPDNTEVLLQRARVLASMLDPEKAMADFGRVLELAPEHARAHADLARFLGHNLDPKYHRHRLALQHAQRAVELDPTNAEFAMILAFLNREDNPQESLRGLNNAIQLNPKLVEAYLRRAMVHWDLDQPEPAFDDLRCALEQNPDYAAAVRFRAEMLAEMKDREKALKEFTRAIDLDPYNPRAYVGRAGVRWQLGETQLAMQDLDAAKNLAPAYPVSYQQSVRLRTQQGDFRQAIDDVNRRIQQQPNNPWLWSERGEIFLRIREYEKALSDFDYFLVRKPDQHHVYKRRAEARFELGRVDAALDDLEKAFELNPQDISTVRWIAPRKFLTQATDDQRNRLMKLANEAVEHHPDGQFRAWALADRATVRFAWGQREKALADCALSVRIDPQDARAWYQRAVADLELQNTASYKKTCAAFLPHLGKLNGAGAFPDYATWTFALAPDSVRDLSDVIGHAERFLKYSLQQERWWEDTGDVGAVWLRQQILGALLYRAEKFPEALQRLRLAESHFNNLSSWPPYARYFLAMTYAKTERPDEAQRWLRLAANWSAEALKDESPFKWHQRVMLRLLRREAEQVVAAARQSESSEQPD